MQIVHSDLGRCHELDVVVHDPDATVADLVVALAGGRSGVALEADGVVVPAGRRLDRAGIRSGVRVRLVPTPPSTPASAPLGGAAPSRPDRPTAADPAGPGDPIGGGAIELAVVGGLDAGARRLIGPGTWPLGRATPTLAIAHDTVSARHATIHVDDADAATVVDEGSLNGTWVGAHHAGRPTALAPGQVARMGAVQVALRSPVDDDRPAGLVAGADRGGATVPFNRPPRTGPPEPPDPVVPPSPVPDRSAPSGVGVVSVLAPVLCGGVMVLVTRQLAFALLLLLSPLMAIGGAVDSRRRGRKGRRRDEARFRRELEDLARSLDARAREHRDRLADQLPDLAELLRRAETPSVRLWERRPDHPDWLHLRLGIGTEVWTPPVEGDRRSQPTEVRAVVRTAGRIADAPVLVDLSDGAVVGVVGPRSAVVAVGRSLVVQAAVHHGPADLTTVVLGAPGRGADWDWAKWLPHTLDPGGSGRRLIADDPDAAEALCRAMLAGADTRGAEARRGAAPGAGSGDRARPSTLVVVDDAALLQGRRAPVRAVLRGGAGPVAGIVLAATEDQLPAVCTTVVDIADADGTARVHHVRRGVQVDDVLACGTSEATARRTARRLARFDDPELGVAGAGLPAIVALLPLLGLDPPTAPAIARRWDDGGRDPDLVTPIGVSEDGVVGLDLVRDGPHGLVAGTTGAGKSELLRSLVAGLAAGASPDHCTFVLIDFKGGSAFDSCARLPHTVGLVTDLDAHLAERALRCLDAELRHRERVLRDDGAPDLAAHRRPRGPEEGDRPALPRLVVVIDEFATLAAELPEFVDRLVGVAQRGRSLGVHLVLATQRPSGAVSPSIRANTNLRIALRVQDAGDSTDVIDVADAARIGRGQPGRALARFGPGEVVPVQTALSTGVSRGSHGPVEVRPFRATGGCGRVGGDAGVEHTEGPTDLALLVDACVEAHAASGRPPPRRPWPDPLPPVVDLEALQDRAGPPSSASAHGAEIVFALADRPDDQVQVPVGWRPDDGNLLLVGLPGSGTTTALLTVAVAAATTTGPDDLHVYGLDHGTGELGVLTGLPHTGAVVPAGDRERQARLITWLRAETERRRGLPAARTTEPRILLLVDGLAPFRAEWDAAVSPVLDGFSRVFAEGPELGIHTCVSADRGAALPTPLRSLVRQQLLFALADDLEYGQGGFRPAELPTFVPGRALDVARHVEVQVARPTAGREAAVAAVASRSARPARAPAGVAALPRQVAVADLLPCVALDGQPRHLPLGVGERTMAVTGLVLHEGEHALVAGPARSGRTTALAVAAAAARHAGWRTAVVAGRRSPLGRNGDLGPVIGPDAVAARLLPALAADAGPVLLLVDDAEAVDPAGHVMPEVLGRPDVVVLAAGRADTLRGLYSHWTRAVRQSRCGLLLQPDVDLDGDLLTVRLPRRSTTVIGPGRGYICGAGESELVQVARPGPRNPGPGGP